MRLPRVRLWSVMFAIAVLAVGLAGCAYVVKSGEHDDQYDIIIRVVKVAMLAPVWLMAAICAAYWMLDGEPDSFS